jgi:hypothetical protein
MDPLRPVVDYLQNKLCDPAWHFETIPESDLAIASRGWKETAMVSIICSTSTFLAHGWTQDQMGRVSAMATGAIQDVVIEIGTPPR